MLALRTSKFIKAKHNGLKRSPRVIRPLKLRPLNWKPTRQRFYSTEPTEPTSSPVLGRIDDPDIESITLLELKSVLRDKERNFLFLDVRHPEECRFGEFPRSVNVPGT